MSPPQILSATGDDRQWAAALMAASDPWTTLGISLENCRATTTDPSNQVFVAWVDQERCGMIILQDKGLAGSPYIKAVAVAPQFRGRGIGKVLLQHAEEHYRTRSRHLFLCVSSFNERAQKFYRENGWEVIGELKDYLAEGFSEILMYKKLR